MPIFILFLLSIASVGIGFLFTWLYAKLKYNFSQKKSKTILEESIHKVEREKQRMLEECREQIQHEKELYDEEIKEQNETLGELESQLSQKSLLLNERINYIKNYRNKISEKEKKVVEKELLINVFKEDYFKKLEKYTDTTREAIKESILEDIILEEKIDIQHVIKKAEYEATRNAESRARHILETSLQRLPMSKVVEYVPTFLDAPGQEMLSRLMTKEGRYIRFLETLLDIDIYIEDTPDGFNLSSPDHIKREIARAAIDRLFKEGKFSANQIKEIVHAVTNEITETMIKEAEEVLKRLKMYILKSDIIKTLGRLLYRYSYGQNQLYHAQEVAQLGSILAAEVGLNAEIAKRGGLFHDIGKGLTMEGKAHVEIGAELARKWGENPKVINVIASHHDDIDKECPEAILVQVADAVSGARPGARRETVTSYLELVEKLVGIASGFEGVERAFAIYAGRELRIMVNSEKVNDESATELASDIAKKIEEEVNYPGKIKITLIREMKFSSYTK